MRYSNDVYCRRRGVDEGVFQPGELREWNIDVLDATASRLDGKRLKELVETLPANKRAAFSKAAKAACQHLRDSKQNYSKAYALAGAMVLNWWRLGQELPRLEFSKGAAERRNPPGDRVTLSQLGINANQSARCQKLAIKSKAELDKWLEEKYDEETYYLPSLKPASEFVHVSANTGQPEWYTPLEYIEAARKTMGTIDLDPASSKIADAKVKAAKFYTLKDDGLSKEWVGNVWLNPPYETQAIKLFAGKLITHLTDKSVKQAICLTNNSTETTWGQSLLGRATAVCFPAGRVRFLDTSLKPIGAPLQGQMICYFGSRNTIFVKEFTQFSEAATYVI